MGNSWMPIETAEKVAEDILVFCASTGEQFVAYRSAGMWVYARGPDGLTIGCEPTHWLSLPPFDVPAEGGAR